MSNVIGEIAAERARQIEVERRTFKHDDTHTSGQLARAAACYAVGGGIFKIQTNIPQQVWPYQWEWKPKDARHDLIRAAALIVAEIERLDRAALKAKAR